MIAAHHIALLLLSTAALGSREHGEIIEQNGPGVWLALGELQLVERESEQSLWQLTERGRVFVDHILSLPLPQLAWRMPGQQQPVMPMQLPTTPWSFAAKPVTLEDTASAPPPTPVSMLPKVDIPTDPSELNLLANRYLDQGYGMNEVATMLKLDPAQMKAIFGAT
jgi:hypothetical protein